MTTSIRLNRSFQRKSTSLFKVKFVDRQNSSYSGHNMMMYADHWGLRLLTQEKKQFKLWIWKLDVYRIECKSACKRSIFVQILSSRFEVKIQFTDIGTKLLFLRQCEDLILIERFEYKTWYNKLWNKSRNINRFFLDLFRKLFRWNSSNAINYYFEPMLSPFERINF